jgi:hypothetical protein
MTRVRWPSPPLPINTRGGGAERRGGKTEQNREGNIRKKIEKGRDDFFEKERNTREGKILEERRRTEREE